MTSSHAPQKRLGQGEFVALIAMLFATIALSIDSMLPSFPAVAETFQLTDPNRAQLIVGTFFLGMGVGTFISGPLSDAYGRKPLILIGGIIYVLASLACWAAQSLEWLLVARVVQGIGAAGPRTVSMALVRDLYKGRDMARIMSFAMMIFMVVPAVAPLMGTIVMHFADWRAIYLVLMVFSLVSALWVGLRQAETLPVERRMPISIKGMLASAREMFSYRMVTVSIVIQSLTIAVLMAMISSIHSVFAEYFGRADTFAYWFALPAALSALASFANSKLVMTLGMRRVAVLGFSLAIVLSLIFLGAQLVGLGKGVLFPIFMLWLISVFTMMAFTMGNLNALTMEPVGHIAGFASSVMAAVSTILSVLISAPIGLAFNGTPLPLTIGAVVLLIASLALMRLLKR